MRTARETTDLITLAHLVVLGLISVVAVTSATAAPGEGFWSGSGFRQLIYLAVGIGLYLAVQQIDYHDWGDMWVLLYLGGLLLLALLPFVARPIGGARSWLELGPLRLQPSEPMKVITALAVAAFLAEARDKLDLVRLVKLGVLVGLPMLLIAIQPDMGTALTFVPLFLGVAWLAGIRGKVLVSLALIGALALPILWFGVLEPYQKERVITVFDPERDPSGSGYQVIQSRIAVGSGQITGKGLFRGSQSRLDFLPARETDFVLAVVAEETGFIGVLVVLGLYLSLLLRTLQTAAISQDPLGAYLAVGVASLWAGQIFINTGMVAGILPTIGVPLPVVSAGGSSVVATFLAFAIVGSVRTRRFVNL
jgi:rod shape determining protein RodA